MFKRQQHIFNAEAVIIQSNFTVQYTLHKEQTFLNRFKLLNYNISVREEKKFCFLFQMADPPADR